MTDETLQFIHRAYQQSVEDSNNILEIVQNLHKILSGYVPNESDAIEFDTFLKGVFTSFKIREKTFEMTNLASDISFVFMYIVIWLNKTMQMHIDINIDARRKGLESELTKLLEKSINDQHYLLHDRFGLRGNILNNSSSEESTDLLFKVYQYLVDILTLKNRKSYSSFMEWIENNPELDNFTIDRIKYILSLPFKIDFVKDYVNNPKPNGYQSIHFVIILEMFSPILPGAEFEMQLRTNYMHQNATNGSANHDEYKNLRKYTDIFKVEDFSKVKIIGFTGYNNVEDDIDGVHYSKKFLNRRISSTLVI